MKVNYIKNILLVEDEILIAMGKQQELEKYGYTVQHVNTGEKAVTIVSENNKIDLILMDIDLGKGIDGTEAAALILEEHDIPIVFMSSHIEPEIVEKTEKITSYGYVVKNSSMTVLDASIKMAFKLFEANTKMSESEEKYRTLFENESAAIFIYDPDTTNIIDANEATSKIYGYNMDELIGMSCLKLSAEVEKSTIVIKTSNKVEKINVPNRLHRKKDGTVFPVDLNNYAMVLGGKDVMFSTCSDITERIKSKEELKLINNRLNISIENMPNAYIQWDYNLHVVEWNKEAEKIFGYSKKEMLGNNPVNYIVPEKDRSQVEEVLKKLQVGEISDYSAKNNNINKDGKLISCHWFNTPLMDGESNITGFITVAQDVTERLNAEEVLHNSENTFRTFFEQAGDYILILKLTEDKDLVIVDANEAAYKKHGYERKEFIGKSIKEIDRSLDDSKIQNRLERIISGESILFETSHTRKDETTFPVEVSAKLLNIEKDRKLIITIERDITKRKQAVKQLEESEKRYRELYNNSPLGYQSLDEEGRFIEVNPALCNLLGYEHDEIIGKWFGDILTKDGVEIFRTNFPKFKARGAISAVPFDMISKSGNVFSVEIDGIIGYDNNGHFKQTHCVIQDVSIRKKLENKSIRYQYYLAKAQELGKIGTWELDIQKNILIWTDENYKIFGVLIGTKMTYDLFLNSIHPDDRDYVYENWKAALNNETYDIEFRIIVNDEIKWVREKAEIEFDKKGSPISSIGVTQDITERKFAKQIEDEATANLNSLLNNRRESIWSIDRNYNYIIFNDFFKEVYYKLYKNELKTGMKALSIKRPDLKEFWKSKYDRAISGEEVVFGFANLVENKLHFYETFLNPIITNKKITGVTALSIDITERKHSEEIIKQQLLEKEIILKESNHRIKNNFNSIVSLLSLQANSSDNTEVQSAINITKGRVQSMGILYEKMLLADNYQTIPVNEYLTSLTDDITNLLIEKNIVVQKQIDDLRFDTKKLFYIGLIINELLTNVQKYAFINRDSGLIKITLKEEKGEIILTIDDNGNGLPKDFDRNKMKGFGLTLISMLSEQLDGTFTIDNHIGTTSVIRFPV